MTLPPRKFLLTKYTACSSPTLRPEDDSKNSPSTLFGSGISNSVSADTKSSAPALISILFPFFQLVSSPLATKLKLG